MLGFAPDADWGGVAFFPPLTDRRHDGVEPLRLASSDYFKPSSAPFMINFVVDDLDGLLAHVRKRGCGGARAHEDMHDIGRFAWLLDPAGVTKIELWQPVEPALGQATRGERAHPP